MIYFTRLNLLNFHVKFQLYKSLLTETLFLEKKKKIFIFRKRRSYIYNNKTS